MLLSTRHPSLGFRPDAQSSYTATASTSMVVVGLQRPQCSAKRVQQCPSGPHIKPQHRRLSVRVLMGIKAMENYDGTFQLQEDSKAKLEKMLYSQTFCKQVVVNCKLEDTATAEFTGELFQPTPWSVNTPKGMAKEFEKYVGSKEYQIINVPPNFMFQASIASPSRLCAVYKISRQA